MKALEAQSMQQAHAQFQNAHSISIPPIIMGVQSSQVLWPLPGRVNSQEITQMAGELLTQRTNALLPVPLSPEILQSAVTAEPFVANL
jgi:hypothetical protein